MNKNGKILIAACLSIAILSLTASGIKSEYFNQQTQEVQNSNTPSPIGTSNVPFQLKVSVVSPLLADGPYGVPKYNTIWVELQDLYGNPARAPKGGLGISLSSSDPQVGTPYDTAIYMYEGRSYARTAFSAGYKKGTTKITANSPGLVSGSASVTTVANTPAKLAVYVTPDTLFADGSTQYDVITVALEDSAGNVAWAQSKIGVTLYSSDLTIGTTPESIYIQAGSQYAKTSFTTKTKAGTTTITATATGLTSGSATVSTIKYQASAPAKLKTFLGPPKVWANDEIYDNTIFVQLLNSTGFPTKATAAKTVSLVSSNPTVGNPSPTSLTIPIGSMYGKVAFDSTNKPGTTSITATASGLTSAPAVTMNTHGYIASQVKTYTMLTQSLADDSWESNWIVAMLQDSSGKPARAQAATPVTYSSSNPSVGTVSSSPSIPLGQILDGVWFDSTFTKGTTTLSGFSSFPVSSTTVTTVGPTPTKLGLYLAPSKVWADSRTYYETVHIVLQDASGNPVRVPNNIDIILSSSNTGVGTVDTYPVTISSGSDSAHTWFQSTSTAGTTTITASAAGYTSGSAIMTTTAKPTVTPYPAPTKLVIEGVPKYISANSWYAYSLSVSLRDASDKPARATQNIGVAIQSSDRLVAEATENFEIPKDDFWSNYLDLSTTYTPGTTTLTAIARISPTTTIIGTKTLTTGEYAPISKSYRFESIPYLFYKNTFLVFGDAAAREAMGAPLFASALTASGTLLLTTKTDTLLKPAEKTSGNLVALGYNNTIRTSYPLGIFVGQNAAWFNITATTEGKSINFTKSDYPTKSVAIVYLKKESTRTIMFLWGYGWQGTYAAALFMSDTAKWQTYATKHLLFLQWADTNTNGFIEKTEITVATSA